MDIAFDTSLLVALLDPQDLWHNQLWRQPFNRRGFKPSTLTA
jgi:hypothetical protein